MTASISLLLARAQGMIADSPDTPAQISARHPLDLLAPRHLWWAHPSLRTVVHPQGDGHLRLRWWDRTLLSPLSRSPVAGVTGPLETYLTSLPSRAPLYPESYYRSREVWSSLPVLPQAVHYLGADRGLGVLESLADLLEDGLGLAVPRLSITLLQGSPVPLADHLPLHPHLLADRVEALWLAPDRLPTTATEVPTPEHPLPALLRGALLTLRPGGTLVWELSLLAVPQYLPLLRALEGLGDTLRWCRPQALHPWEPTVYLVLAGWRPVPGWWMYLQRTPDAPWSGEAALLAIIGEWVDSVEATSRGTSRPSGERLAVYLRAQGLSTVGELGGRTPLPLTEYRLTCLRGITGPAVDPGLSTIRPAHLAALRQSARTLALCKRLMDSWPSGSQSRGEWTSWEDIHRHSEHDMQHLSRDLRQTVRAVSNAWLKLWEMLHLDPRLGEALRGETWHLCEAPGAWVSACGRWAEDHGHPYHWRAQTLPPDGGEVLGDHYHLLRDYPEQWDLGDITDPETLRGYRTRQADLITADGGRPLAPHRVNYGELECLPLLQGQILAICQSLRVGGSALVKVWLPLALPATLGLLRLWTGVFEVTYLVKPVASRPGNSEIYLVGHGYLGTPEWALERLYSGLPSPDPRHPVVSISDVLWMTGMVDAVRRGVQAQCAWLSALYQSYYLGNRILQAPWRASVWKQRVSGEATGV